MTPIRRRHNGAQFNILVALVCVLAGLGIWLVTLQRIAFERNQAVAAAMKSNANLAIALEQQTFRTFKAAEQVAAFVREQYLLRGAALDLAAWVDQRVIRDARLTIVSVVDEAGRVVASSQPTGAVNYADRAFFQAQRDGQADAFFISAPVLGRVSGRWQIPMSLRITRPDGGFAGVVVMSVDPADFAGFEHQGDLGPRGLLELTGLDGVVRGRKVGGARSFGLPAQELTWFQRQRTERSGDLVDNGVAVDGVERIVSYRTLDDYPLMVAVGTASADELAPFMQRRLAYLVMAWGATAALLGAAVLLMLTLARRRAAAEALRSSEAVFRATFDQAAMGIAHIAPDGRILRANDKFCRMLGHETDALRGRNLLDLSDPAHRDEARQFLSHRLSAFSPVFSPEIEKPYRRKDGSLLWACEALGVVKLADGRPDFLVAVVQDITARKDLEARLSHDALHDALTGLANRVMFQDRLDQVLETARRYRHMAAVLYLDLDGFKEVNDCHGHAAGDTLLQQAASRLGACVRAEDTVARIGGDEFAVVLAHITHEGDCELVAHKILQAIAAPFPLPAGAVHISASVGAALFPRDGVEAAALVAHADGAMYAAKSAGKNRFSWPV